MSGPQWPPEGFRWVQPTDPGQQPAGPPGSAGPGSSHPGDAPAPSRRTRRRWWWVVAVVAVVAVVVAAGVAAVLLRGSGQTGRDTAAAPFGTPQDLLVSFPLNRQPVPAWTTTTADIGLPDGIQHGMPFASTDDKAYFVTQCQNSYCEDDEKPGWVYGVDIHTGARLFAPVPLVGYGGGPSDCFNNGPGIAICLTEGDAESGYPALVWVVDLDHGTVTFTGPTELFEGLHSGPEPTLNEVGTFRGQGRTVALADGTGVHGVGPQAELTWFVPGDGTLNNPIHPGVIDIPPLTVAVQFPKPGDEVYRVFSVIDGTDLTPTAPEGTTLGKAVVYNGGFAYEVKTQDGSGGLLFYDTAGHLQARQQPREANLFLLAGSEMPIALQLPENRWHVYTAAGELVTDVPAEGLATRFRIIGTKLYVQQGAVSGEDQTWQQWDLHTGQPGPTCRVQLDAVHYIGSDGTVVITETGVLAYKATDTSTCQTLWETPNMTPIWKVGTGLIQDGSDSYTISGLRPPD